MNIKYNTKFFREWSHEMAYTLGYFAADGNMSSVGNKSISFDSIDESLLNNISSLIGIGPAPKNYTKNIWTLRIGSVELYDQLIDLGFTENKSLNIQFPTIPTKYKYSFLRGVFDGDGWICKSTNGYNFGICSSSLNFINSIKTELEILLDKPIYLCHKTPKQSHHNINYTIQINDLRDLSIIYQHLYFDSTPLTRLDRKYKFFSFIKKMDCYFIPPVNALRFMDNGTKHIFCLAHLYLKYPKYKKYMLNLRNNPRAGIKKFITLDNSAAERSLVTVETLLDIVEELKPDEVISPDILFDKTETINKLNEFIRLMDERQLSIHTKIFGCPQGRTKDEWLECYEYMLNCSSVSVIGLSKIAVPKCWLNKIDDEGIKESRNMCVDYLMSNNLLKKQIHFLGMGDPTEYTHYRHILLRSTDSCYTIWAAMNNIKFAQGDNTRIPTPHDYFEKKLSRDIDSLVRHNISFLRSQLK